MPRFPADGVPGMVCDGESEVGRNRLGLTIRPSSQEGWGDWGGFSSLVPRVGADSF